MAKAAQWKTEWLQPFKYQKWLRAGYLTVTYTGANLWNR
jgi:hypothetical protein